MSGTPRKTSVDSFPKMDINQEHNSTPRANNWAFLSRPRANSAGSDSSNSSTITVIHAPVNSPNEETASASASASASSSASASREAAKTEHDSASPSSLPDHASVPLSDRAAHLTSSSPQIPSWGLSGAVAPQRRSRADSSAEAFPSFSTPFIPQTPNFDASRTFDSSPLSSSPSIRAAATSQRTRLRSATQLSQLETIQSGVVPTFNSPYTHRRSRVTVSELQQEAETEFFRDLVANHSAGGPQQVGGGRPLPLTRGRAVSERSGLPSIEAIAAGVQSPAFAHPGRPRVSFTPIAAPASSFAVPPPINPLNTEQFPDFPSAGLANPSLSAPTTATGAPQAPKKRARSMTFCGVNPLEEPITPQEQAVSNLAQSINRRNRRESLTASNNRRMQGELERQRRHDDLYRSGGYSGNKSPKGFEDSSGPSDGGSSQ